MPSFILIHPAVLLAPLILLEQSFTAHMPLLTATSTFGLRKRCHTVFHNSVIYTASVALLFEFPFLKHFNTIFIPTTNKDTVSQIKSNSNILQIYTENLGHG